MTTESRREFEEWAMSQDVSMFTFKNRKGKYADPITQTAWEAWQAARDQLTEQRDELLRYNEAFRNETLICADCDSIRKEEYDQAIEQRDRLAEAMTRIVNIYENPEKGCIPSSSDMYDEALQSAQSPLVRGCSHDPRTLAGMPIGQYHCPECGEMVIAGLAHDPEPPTMQNG